MQVVAGSIGLFGAGHSGLIGAGIGQIRPGIWQCAFTLPCTAAFNYRKLYRIYLSQMQPSLHIHTELQRCRELLDLLARTSSPLEFDDIWQRFLGHLERVWNKSQNHFSKSPKWGGWQGRYVNQRKTDPLLIYLINARGAHEHTVQDITNKTPGSIGLSAGSSGRVHIKSLQVGPDGITGDWDGDLAITFTPGRVDLAPVKNRGRTYAVPSSHLGIQIDNTSALTIGALGLEYYQNLVTEAEGFFAK